MPHFFITTNDIKQDIITISDKDNFHHITRVLRAKIGEPLLLIDENRIQYKTVIEKIDSNSITTLVAEKYKSRNILNLQLSLAQAVLKTDAQNLVVQKAAELGVKGIVPFIGENSVIKKSVAEEKISKWQKIANEAAKQCERVDSPVITGVESLKNLLNDDTYDYKIACVERVQDYTLKACLKNIKSEAQSKILVIIGPEGGFSAEEIKLIENSSVSKVSLGKMILRAETAAVSALSNIIYELEDD
jgi:16S rRNA (uracil1498-N3)-methyltransferase